MARNIRMPDSTVIRGVPDGVSKDEINQHLIEKYGQDRFDKMTGSTRKSLSEQPAEPAQEPTSSASSYLRNIEETQGRPPTIEETNEAVRMRRKAAGKSEFPEDPTKYSNPYQSTGPGMVTPEGEEVMAVRKDEPVVKPLTGKLKERADILRAEDEEPSATQMDPDRDILAVETAGADDTLTSSAPGGGFLGLPAKRTKEERITEQGRIIERMVDLGIKSAADYGMTPEEIDSVMEDKTSIEMLRRKAAAEGAPDAPVEEREGASYWKALKKKVSNLGEEFFRIQEAPEAAARVREQQYETLGAMYLDAVAHENPELADDVNDIIDDVAGQYGIDGATYHRTLATQLDHMFKEEQMTIDGVQAYQKELIEDMPHATWEDNKFGYIGGKLIENSNSVAYMAAGMATRSPSVLAALMGTDIFNRTYTDARADGRTQGEAFQDSVYSASIEAATEGIPLGMILKAARVGNRSRAAKLLIGLGSEATQEMAVEALQIGYDMNMLDEDITVGEAFVRMRDSGILGAVMGGGMSAPSIIAGDNVMNNLNSDVRDAKKNLQSVALRLQGDMSLEGTLTKEGIKQRAVSKKEIDAAKQQYADAVKTKGDEILRRKTAEAEKKQAKADKKETKRKSKLSETEARRESAAEAAEKADQALVGDVTNDDILMADTLERATNAELTEEDADGVQRALDAGYMQITSAGTPVVLPAGKRRLEAVRLAEGGSQAAADVVIEPTPYKRPETREADRAVDEEIGRRIRGEEEPILIEPKPFTSQQRRKADLTKRVASKVTDPAVREKIADDIIKAEEIEEAYNNRNIKEAARIEQQRNEDYSKALDQVVDVDLDVAANLALLDEMSVSGYKGTQLGDVLRRAMNVLEREESKAIEALKKKFANMSEQGTLFDVTGVLAKGTAMYSNAVKVGALKIAKHGLKYSAWTADMIGEFGESIRPVLARVFHDSKKKVQDIMRLSHEKFASGKRKGELKYSPKQYAKPGHIRRLRETLRKLAREGAEGRLWYEKSGAEILKITGGNKKLARKLAGLFAIYSSGTAVSANTTNALKMWAQFYGSGKLTKPKQGTIAGRFGEQDRTAIEWMNSQEGDENFVESFGNKRFPFYQNIMRAIDPKNYEMGQGVTVDMWMMRALGYDTDAPTDAQYAFVSSEIVQIAKEMGWENQQAQAAIWVAIKSRWEFVQKRAKEKAVKAGLAEIVIGDKGAPVFEVIGETREEQIENEKKVIIIFRDEALKVSSSELTNKLEQSKADFADNLANHYATISWEAEPSTKLGSMLNAMSLADKIMMQQEIAELLTNPKTGREYLAEWLQLLGRDQIVGPGSWDMSVGSVVQNSVVVPIKHKPGKIKEAQQEAKDAMDGYAAILGFLMQQDAVAWHKPFYATTLKDANGVEIITKTLTHAKTLKFYEEIFNLTHNSDHAPIVIDGAVRVLNFSDMPNREFHKLIAQAADAAGVAGNIEVFQSDGTLVSNDWATSKKGQDYVEAINNNKNPLVKQAFERAKRKFSRQLAEIYEEYSSEKTNARVKTTRLDSGTKLKSIPKGHLRFRVFRKGEYGVLDVDRAGEGLKGAEQKRGAMKVISAYPNTGFKKEPGLGSIEYVIDVPKTKLYDVNADHLNIKDRAMEDSGGSFKIVNGKRVSIGKPRLNVNKLEQLIKDEGFAGYYTPKAEGNLKGQARFFESLVVDNGSAKVDNISGVTGTYSVSDRPRVTVVENEFDEYEVREKNGEVYYATDPDDAINTARSVHGAYATVVIVDQDGEVITTDVVSTQPMRTKLTKPDKDTAASIEEFVDEWMEVTQGNPLSPDERVVGGVAAVTIRPQGSEIWLDSIRSFNKGTGGGSSALKTIIELADMHGVTLRMTAKPFETDGNELDHKTLVNWYSRNGFVTTRTDEDYAPSSEMVRHPRNAEGNRGKFSAWKRPNRKTNVGYGIHIQRVRDFAQSFGRRLGIANFVVIESIEELPDDVYVDIMKVGGYFVNGVFHEDPILGPTIYIVANNLFDVNMNPDVDLMVETFMHETIGHFGTRAFLGEKGYNDFMDSIRRAFPKEVRRRGKDMSMTPYGRRLAAEEVFAYFVGEHLKGVDIGKVATSFLDKAILQLKLFLANMGVRNLKQADLFDMMFRVTDYVRTTPQELLQKRAMKVEKMRDALWVRTNKEYRLEWRRAESEHYRLDRMVDKFNNSGKPVPQPLMNEWVAAKDHLDQLESGEYITARFSMNLENERRDDPALDRFMTKIGHGHGSKLVRLRDWWEMRRKNIKRAFEIELLDQFAGIKHMERSLGILGPESGYMSVRLTAGVDVIIRSAIENAVPTWDLDGSVRMDASTEGLLEVLAPVAQDPEMLKAFEAFLVARRARRLGKENRERLFSREEIGAALKFIRKNKVYTLFKNTADDLATYKSKVLDFAMDAGLIDPVSRQLWENNDHVPFYRVLAEADKKGVFSSSRIGSVGKVIHRLKGGQDPLRHPLESIVKNLSMLIEASVKNRATGDVIRNFMGTGVVTKAPQAEISQALIPMKQIKDMLFENGVSLDAVGQDLLDGVQKLTSLQAPTGDNIISVQEGGKKQYYYVHDAGVMRGIDNVSPNQWIWLMKVLRLPKRLLTRSITLMPDFILKNWFRDIFHTYMLHRHGTVIPVLDSGRGWAKAIAHDDTFKDMIAGGGVFDAGFVNASDPERTNIAIRRGLLGRGRHGILDTPKKLKDFYMRIANGAENAHRIIVYEKTLQQTGSRKQALFEARDLMDFSVRGANPIIRFLTETVPFWGARVQGLSRTTKGFTENPALTLMRATPIILASMALMAYNRDDDRYKGLNDYEKRMYYHFYDVFEGGDHYRLPKPFEVGAVFSTIPEILTELMLSDEPDKGQAASAALAWTIKEQLSLWPDVQAVNPFYELMINENRFTKAPIVSTWEEQLDPRDQYSYRSDKSIKWLTDHMPDAAPDVMKSPKKMEHLLRGYLGAGLDYALAASQLTFDKQLNGDAPQPTMRWDETPFFKSFKREEYGKYDIYLDSMYSVLEEANKIHNSINLNRKLPKSDQRDARIAELKEMNQAVLYARGRTSAAAKQVSTYNKQIRKVYADTDVTPDQKAEKIESLLRKRSQAAQKVYDYRPGGKLNKYEGGDAGPSYWEQLMESIKDKPKDEQVDELISAQLPHTATLINDITISDEKLRSLE